MTQLERAPVSPRAVTRKPHVVVVVPTYNEAENLPELVERLFELPIGNTSLIVLDDSSPDGTAKVAKQLAGKLDGRLQLIERRKKMGLGTAYVEGFSRALTEDADYVLQMDADLSHEPETIPAMLAELEDADVVVGSRYAPGGGVGPSWSVWRKLLSAGGNLGIRIITGLNVKDATSGFKAYRASALRSLELQRFRCKGFGFQAEVAYACQQNGYRVVEHPITFLDRTRGRSKMSLAIVIEAVWRLLVLRLRGRPQIADT